MTKPRLTYEHIKNRLKFSEKWIKKIEENDGNLYYCFLNKKWFYTTSCCKKLKFLPIADFEDPEKAFVRKPEVCSRRFPCKVMFMAIICPPIKNHSDGKILL